MVMPRKRGRPPSSNRRIDDDDGTQDAKAQEASAYEKIREDNIKRINQVMQSFGIQQLSLELKASMRPHKPARGRMPNGEALQPSPIHPSGPTRRSSRLQKAAPVDYSETLVANGAGEEIEGLSVERSKPEVYTEAHEKLLGSTEKSWTLFVDGYGGDGKRIYDPVKGKTCHQCRQKTLGLRTSCSKCNMVQGQFCGDCLYMRYGEHVLEALENPNWICPVCRGICNCSLCRQAKGLAPTGQLYKKISRLGFKSVAHYLIQTQRSQPSLGTDPDSNIPLSDKNLSIDNIVRESSPKLHVSLPVLDMNALAGSSLSTVSHPLGIDNKENDGLKADSDAINSAEINQKIDEDNAAATKLSADSIGGELEQRQCAEGNGFGANELMKDREENVVSLFVVPCDMSESEASRSAYNSAATKPNLKPKKKPVSVTKPSPDSIAGRLRLRRGPDSIAGRLRQRRREGLSC